MLIRDAVVAGTFYNLNQEMLRKQINALVKHKFGPKNIEKQKFIAAIVPHAGYEYSGPVAAWVYSRIENANYIIIGPNHSGIGSSFAIVKEGIWKTPLGEVVIDRNVAEKIMDTCELVEYDVLPHQNEHSIEVQLPFLQFRFGNDFKFVPISILNAFPDDNFLEQCRIVGKTIAAVVKKQKEKWMILASSDFTHNMPHEIASDIDNYIIASIMELDENRFFAKIVEKNATVCGYGPIATAMIAAKELGAGKTELLCYKTSGDVTGDIGSVVGYASIILY